MNFLSKEQMHKLTTKRLLAYKKKLLSCNEGPNVERAFFGSGVLNITIDKEDNAHKESPEWKQAYAEAKAILATRENVE